MKTKLVTALLTAGAIGASAAGIWQTWKGMLVAQPAELTNTIEQGVLNLNGFRTVDVLVKRIPDELKDSVTRDDIEEWAANRLKNIGLGVVTNDELEDISCREKGHG